MKTYNFKTSIDIIIGNPFVFVPEKILQRIFADAEKDRGAIPIKGKMNGAAFTQTLVKYDGNWRLYVNGIMLKAAGIPFKWGEINKVVGTEVEFEIEFDAQSRKLPMHNKLKAALAKDAKAKTAFEALAPYRKHEILRYLGFLKTDESVELNIERILRHLRGEKTDKLHALMHTKK